MTDPTHDEGPAVASQASGPRVALRSVPENSIDINGNPQRLRMEGADGKSPCRLVASLLGMAALELRAEGRDRAADVAERLRQERLRTTPEVRERTRRRQERQAGARALDAALSGTRPQALPEHWRRAAEMAEAELRDAGLYGPASARVLAVSA